MTIINPNSISGIVSVTATSNALHFYESDGDKLNINADVTGNVTGNITGTTATFSGDVTVGGVITYDDVTNVDSVGLGTFRNGLHVTGGSIGIKNTSPNNTLTVGDTVQPSYAPTRAGNYIEIARTSGADAGLLINKNTGQWLLGINNGDGANAPLRFEYAAAGSSHPGLGAGTLGMIIKHDGSVGIGTDDPETSIKLDVRGAVIGNSFGSSLLVTPSNALTPSWTTVSSGSDPSSVPSGLVSVSVDPVLSQGTSLQIFLDLGVSVTSVTFDFNTVLDTNFYYPGWKVSNNGSSWTNKGAINTDSNGVITLTDSNPFRYVALRSLTNYNGGTIATVESTTTTPSASEPDTNTKINFPASDTVAVETGGTERLRITSTGSVGISSTAPKTDVDISQKTGAVALPQGTTAQRPTGSAPYIRKNTTNNALEYYDGTSWVEIITDYFPTGSTILG